MSEAAIPRTLVMIPALNEADSIEAVIAKIRQHVPWADIAVLNDGSSDATGAIAEAHGAIVLHLPYNVGIGAAVQTGFLFAYRNGYDAAIQTDGDGQHPPHEIPRLIEALQAGAGDVVIGSRYLEDRGYQTPWNRRTGIIILSALISAVTKMPCSDPTSGFRASGRRAIALCARLYPHDYPEPEAIVLLRRAGLRVAEIPVTMQARQGGKSSITPLKSGTYMAKVILAILIGMLRRAPRIDDEV